MSPRYWKYKINLNTNKIRIQIQIQIQIQIGNTSTEILRRPGWVENGPDQRIPEQSLGEDKARAQRSLGRPSVQNAGCQTQNTKLQN